MHRAPRIPGIPGAMRAGDPPPARPVLDPWWSPENAAALARTFGLEELGDLHWKVIMACREEAARTGHAPSLRQVSGITGLDPDQLEALFPTEFEATVARISGLCHPA